MVLVNQIGINKNNLSKLSINRKFENRKSRGQTKKKKRWDYLQILREIRKKNVNYCEYRDTGRMVEMEGTE